MINSQLLQKGHTSCEVQLSDKIENSIIKKNWAELDQELKKTFSPGSELELYLKSLFNYTQLEHMIAIRSAPEDEEGIWHEDWSRQLAFSLSLNFSPSLIQGGSLLLRKKRQKEVIEFPAQPYGKLIIFLTGAHEFEHRVTKVSKGERIVCAGWLS